MTSRISATARLPKVAVATLLLIAPGAATAQSTAPSTITPPSLRPAPTNDDDAVLIGQAGGLAPPPNAKNLVVTIDRINVEGGFADAADETATIVSRLVHRPVSLADLYAGASAIEAAHARRGFILARVVVPPQRVTNGGVFHIVVIDGFIERADVSHVPRRARKPVRDRIAPIVGEKHEVVGTIEQALLLAGDVPGLSLTSTLARGEQPGGVQLVLAGRQHLLSGSLAFDNDLAPSLGRYEVSAQLSINSLLGLGEQIYGLAVSNYQIDRLFRGDTPVEVLGGGVVLPFDRGRITLNPEVTFARTRPAPQADVPDTLGLLRRISLRAGYVVEKTRKRAIALNGVVEQVSQSSDAVDFGVRLSLDRYVATRFGASYSGRLGERGSVFLAAQVSHGLGGLGGVRPEDLPTGTLSSRQGAAPDFTKATGSLRLTRSLGHAIDVSVWLKGQTGFGKPLFRAEQAELEGRDALSAYESGDIPVDSAVVGRAEIGTGLSAAFLRVSPYVFGAAGHGWIARPTAVEEPTLDAYNAGVGLRGVIARTPIGYAVEYAHGFSPVDRLDRINRVSVSATVQF